MVVGWHTFLLDQQLHGERQELQLYGPARHTEPPLGVGASASFPKVRYHVPAPDMRRRVPFVSAGDPAFALPYQGAALLPGKAWWGAAATVPTRVRALADCLKRPLRTWHLIAVR